MHHVLKGMVAERTLFWDFPEQIKVENRENGQSFHHGFVLSAT